MFQTSDNCLLLFSFSQGSTYFTALIRFLKLHYYFLTYNFILILKLLLLQHFCFPCQPLPIISTTCCFFMFKSNFNNIELKSPVYCLSQIYTVLNSNHNELVLQTVISYLTLHLDQQIIASWKFRMLKKKSFVRSL